jgi:ADP-ribose pyrophosphatase
MIVNSYANSSKETKRISEEVLFRGRWLSIKETTYEHKSGHKFRWESVVRRKNSSSVIIIPKLIPSQRFVLIKQFRPAINGYVLGFPAGLDDDSDEQIIEELREETGFTGRIREISPVIKASSGVINDSGRIVYVHIDEHDQKNIDPEQKLESSEEIEVILIKQNEIKDYLVEANWNGIAIGANLWYMFVASEWIKE